jgi:hypothetical protein
MTDNELLQEFVRVTKYPDVIVIFVGEIRWRGHEPDLSWIPLLALPVDASPDKVHKANLSVLTRKRYFAVCQECNEKKPSGWMLGADECQSCAEKRGVRF